MLWVPNELSIFEILPGIGVKDCVDHVKGRDSGGNDNVMECFGSDGARRCRLRVVRLPAGRSDVSWRPRRWRLVWPSRRRWWPLGASPQRVAHREAKTGPQGVGI
jgi:hypothetical protein